MPTARICLRHSRWYLLFVFYSLMSYTHAFYVMQTTTKPNLFANYGVTKKKDYKAELLKELAAEEDLYLATSTVHFLKRLKAMKYKYVTDSDVEEMITQQTRSPNITARSDSSIIQNKSSSLKNKTIKTFDSLWNMMKTLSDDTWGNTRAKDSKTSMSYNERHTVLDITDSTKSEEYDEYFDFVYTQESEKPKNISKTTTTRSKFKVSKWFGKKKKIKPSKHKKKKGHNSNSTGSRPNIVNISVRRLRSTPSCKCKSNKSVTKVSKDKKFPSHLACKCNQRKRIGGNRNMKRRKNRLPLYKVNNTIMLSVHNNPLCLDCKKKKKTKNKSLVTVTDLPTTQIPSTTIITTTSTGLTTTTTIATATATTITQTTATPTTTAAATTTQLAATTTQLLTTNVTETTIRPRTTTEDDDCPDFYTCANDEKKIAMPCHLCSNNYMKELNQMHNEIVTVIYMCTRKNRNHNAHSKTLTGHGFKTTILMHGKNSYQTSIEPTTSFDYKLRKFCASQGYRICTTPQTLRKKGACLSPKTIKYPIKSDLYSRNRKGHPFTNLKIKNNRNKYISRKRTTHKARDCTATCCHNRPSLNGDSNSYENELKDTEIYEDYYEGYDESSTANNTWTKELLDDGNKDLDALPHHDADGSTLMPDDDPSLSAYNLLNLFPFNLGKVSTAEPEEYYIHNLLSEHGICDQIPNSLESIAKNIYGSAIKLQQNLEDHRSERTFLEKRENLVKKSMESLTNILKRCNYLLREINFSKKGYIRKLQQLLELSKVKSQVENRIKGKLHQILDDLKRRNPNFI